MPTKKNKNDVIEELERLQYAHQLILDAAGEGIYGLDCDGKTTFVNEAARAETKQKQDFSDQLGTDLDDRITTQRMSTGWRAPSGV